MTATQPKPRKGYRAPDAERRSVRICQDIPVRSRGKRTGAVKLAAYGFQHLAALFNMTDKEIRLAVKQGRFAFNLLSSIIVFAAADRKRLNRIRRMAKSRRQLPLLSPAPAKRKQIATP